LLHHEGCIVTAADGFWPAKKLRDIAKKIGSPYPLQKMPALNWDKYILTPSGAEWAINVVSQISLEIDDLMHMIHDLNPDAWAKVEMTPE
jgi:hypothetical protein